MNSTAAIKGINRALPAGRILRSLLGAWMILLVWPFFSRSEANQILRAVLIFVGLVVLYSLIHWLVSSFLTRLNRWLGAVLAILPVLLIVILGGVIGQVAGVTFIGISLLLDAIRADAGCEVMAIPSLIFSRRTHLVCLLFCPLDWVEAKIVATLQR